MTICYVRWKDAKSEEASGFDTPAKAELAEVESVGFLLDENEEALQFGMENDSPQGFEPGRFRLSIAKAMILERVDMTVEDYLKKKRKPRRVSR